MKPLLVFPETPVDAHKISSQHSSFADSVSDEANSTAVNELQHTSFADSVSDEADSTAVNELQHASFADSVSDEADSTGS
ncbi:unnamed protein product [Linum tenue]|uniref:Uncharacterized protein n=1 Tax=Linum tenue TaxID=586396 RepID=A0AAV0LG78_9ROSI|nr:unnamed protein product [Linum tenue]